MADEQLAKKGGERGRTLDDESEKLPLNSGRSPKRSRSVSSSSSDSVSTISTNRSHSLSPKRPRHDGRGDYLTSQQEPLDLPSYRSKDRKRRRSMSSSSSALSYDSTSSIDRRRSPSKERRNTRRRRSAFSPEERGRRRSSDRRYSKRSRSRSRDESMDKSQIARHRRSMTPKTVERGGNGLRSSRRQNGGRNSPDFETRTYNRPSQTENARNHPPILERRGNQAPPPRKERSLSPFSKRVALTQAMSTGR